MLQGLPHLLSCDAYNAEALEAGRGSIKGQHPKERPPLLAPEGCSSSSGRLHPRHTPLMLSWSKAGKREETGQHGVPRKGRRG